MDAEAGLGFLGLLSKEEVAVVEQGGMSSLPALLADRQPSRQVAKCIAMRSPGLESTQQTGQGEAGLLHKPTLTRHT